MGFSQALACASRINLDTRCNLYDFLASFETFSTQAGQGAPRHIFVASSFPTPISCKLARKGEDMNLLLGLSDGTGAGVPGARGIGIVSRSLYAVNDRPDSPIRAIRHQPAREGELRPP